MQGTKVQKRERGITLIALVVTIIVLLILAGVSIQMLTGQSGILNQARQAKEETEKGQLKESVQREILEGMMKKQGEDLTADEMYKILDKYFKDVTEPGEGEENPWNAEDFPDNFPPLRSREGGYLFQLGDIYSGGLSGTQTSQGGTPGNPDPETGIFAKNSTIDGTKGSYNNPTIPAGFKPVNPEDDISVGEATWNDVNSSVNKGLVIEDEEHNQFVWVPVPKAIADAETSKNIEAETQVDLTNTDLTPMAEKDANGHYRGVLYDEHTYTISDTVKTVKYMGYSSSYREPDTVTDSDSGTKYDADSSNFEIINGILTDPTEQARHTVGKFKETMQKDYDDMVESVAKYGGFYVARYEMSLSSDEVKKAQYKKGETSANAGSSATGWYGSYAYEKQFATVNRYSSVKSSMIWGSQWDAMMNWMARSGIDVASGTIKNKSKNATTKTGLGNTGADNSTDVLNNVYDLLGNRREWTLEAAYTVSRPVRGGTSYSHDDDSPSYRYWGNSPLNPGNDYGSRGTLYIK